MAWRARSANAGDVPVLVVLVDRHLHRADLRDTCVAHAGLHDEVDAGDHRSAPSSSLSNSAAMRSVVMRDNCGAISSTASHGPTGDRKTRDEPGGPQHPSGSSPKDTAGGDGVSSTPSRNAASPPSGSRNSPGPRR